MVIEKITGGKPQEVRQAEKADRKSAETPKEGSSKPSEASSSIKTEVSARSHAAIKAYRIASESKPNISRADRVAQLKSEIAGGNYKTGSVDVANSILKSVVNGA